MISFTVDRIKLFALLWYGPTINDVEDLFRIAGFEEEEREDLADLILFLSKLEQRNG